MRARSAALLMVAIGCGLVASVGVTRALSNRTEVATTVTADDQKVFVVIKDIPLGEIVAPEMLRMEKWPKDKVPEGAISSIEQFEGRRTKTKLYAGEVLMERKLFQKGAGGAADDLIPKGYRAVAVKVDAVSGFHDMLSPGSRVDVMVYLRYAPEQGIHETTTRCILQDIKVFAVNDTLLPDSKDQSSKSSGYRERTVSLLVTPEQAAALTLASEMGRIRLVLRSPDDDQQAPISEVTSTALFGRPNAGQRKREELTEPAAENPVADKLRELLAAAAGAKSRPAEQASSSNRWVVRVLRPGAIDDIELHAEQATNALAHAGGIWKLVNAAASGQSFSGKSLGAAKAADRLPDNNILDAEHTSPGDKQPALGQPHTPITPDD